MSNYHTKTTSRCNNQMATGPIVTTEREPNNDANGSSEEHTGQLPYCLTEGLFDNLSKGEFEVLMFDELAKNDNKTSDWEKCYVRLVHRLTTKDKQELATVKNWLNCNLDALPIRSRKVKKIKDTEGEL